MRFVLISFVAIAVVGSSSSAEEAFSCGTEFAGRRRASVVAASSFVKPSISAADQAAPAALRTSDNIALVPASQEFVPYFHQFDLAGTSLVFTRESDATYRARKLPLSFDPDRGAQLNLTLDGRVLEARVHLPFTVRVFGTQIQDVYVSTLNAITAVPQTSPEFWQYDSLELASLKSLVIAPLLSTPLMLSRSGAQAIYGKASSDSYTITWQASDYDVRATLYANGTIIFSYVRVEPHRAAQSSSVVITSGAEAWRSNVAWYGSANPGQGGVDSATPTDLAPVLDVLSARVGRVAGTELLRVELVLAQAPSSAVLGNDGAAFYNVTLANVGARFLVLNRVSGDRRVGLSFPRPMNGLSGSSSESLAATITGNTLTFAMVDDVFSLPLNDVTVSTSVTRSGRSYRGETVKFPLSGTRQTASTQTDFGRLSATGTSLVSVAESFVRPTVNLDGIWAYVRDTLRWTNATVDAVAVYENFATDLDFFAGAYSTVGNSQAVGVVPDYDASREPVSPNLMQMNRVTYTSPMPLHETALMHEFGHRWLFYLAYRDSGGMDRSDLNPDGGHPAQYVNQPAAFAVATNRDCSVMGGGVFTPQADASYSVSASAYGFSWLDLYLMGLASPNEVQPFFFLSNTTPPLGVAYWPQVTTARGTPIGVKIEDVVAATGIRKPAYPNTQRTFRLLFILLYDPIADVSANDTAGVSWHRETIARDFPTATGGRAHLEAAAPEMHAGQPRRRSVSH